MFFWKRKCCCGSTDYKSCGCPTGIGTSTCSDLYDLDKPDFPSTITINYTRSSLCALSAAGYGSVFDYDHDCCNGGTPCTSPDAGFCGTCAEGSSHSGGDTRLVAGSEISKSESPLEITLALQDGTNGRNGDPAPTACIAYYRKVIRHEYESLEHDELECTGCEDGEGSTHGGYWDCWRLKLELDRYSTGTRKTRITATITMKAQNYLEYGLSGDVTTPPDDTSLSTKYSGTYSAEFIGIGEELSEDINGNQDCGYCYFPYLAFDNLELTSGGDTDLGDTPDPDGTDTDMSKFGSWDTEYCCDYLTGICHCTLSIDYPTWDTNWWNYSTLVSYLGTVAWKSPVREGRCESTSWSALTDPPTIGAVCVTTTSNTISPAGDCVPDCDPPPCDYSNVQCLSYQSPTCIGPDVEVWYAWTNQLYLNVSLSL